MLIKCEYFDLSNLTNKPKFVSWQQGISQVSWLTQNKAINLLIEIVKNLSRQSAFQVVTNVLSVCLRNDSLRVQNLI